MIFNSLQFLMVFPAVAARYFFLTMRLRNNTLSQLFLLAGSLFFYACWNPEYLALILLSAVVTWASGLLADGQSRRRKRLVLGASMAINMGAAVLLQVLRLLRRNRPAWSAAVGFSR